MRTGSSSKLLDEGGNIINPATEETVQSILDAMGGAGKTTITEANVALTNADTEYSYALPTNTKGFLLKARKLNSQLKFCFTSGQSGTTYFTITYNDRFNSFEYNVDLDGKTLYFQSTKAGDVAEIIVFT